MVLAGRIVPDHVMIGTDHVSRCGESDMVLGSATAKQCMIDIEQITIVGTGLIGGSIGLSLRAAGYKGRIVGVGRRRATVERARQCGCIDAALTNLDSALEAPQLLILATPLRQIPLLLAKMQQPPQLEYTVTDVGSTKQQICQEVRNILPDPTIFVGSHPMAGGEQHGPENAVANLFEGKPCVITPEDDTGSGAIAIVQSLWSTLGMRVTQMSPLQHDRQVAWISHLPHALAVLLIELASEEGALDLASSGFRDTTRIASGDPGVWLDIFMTNKDAVIEAVDRYSDHLGQFRELLQRGSEQGLIKLLNRAKAERDRWVEQF